MQQTPQPAPAPMPRPETVTTKIRQNGERIVIVEVKQKPMRIGGLEI